MKVIEAVIGMDLGCPRFLHMVHRGVCLYPALLTLEDILSEVSDDSFGASAQVFVVVVQFSIYNMSMEP